MGIGRREWARTIENISRIRMDVARASGDENWTKSDFIVLLLLLIGFAIVLDCLSFICLWFWLVFHGFR